MSDGEHLRRVLTEAARKLKGAMLDGPYGPNVELTTEEACVLLRVMETAMPETMSTINY